MKYLFIIDAAGESFILIFHMQCSIIWQLMTLNKVFVSVTTTISIIVYLIHCKELLMTIMWLHYPEERIRSGVSSPLIRGILH